MARFVINSDGYLVIIAAFYLQRKQTICLQIFLKLVCVLLWYRAQTKICVTSINFVFWLCRWLIMFALLVSDY